MLWLSMVVLIYLKVVITKANNIDTTGHHTDPPKRTITYADILCSRMLTVAPHSKVVNNITLHGDEFKLLTSEFDSSLKRKWDKFTLINYLIGLYCKKHIASDEIRDKFDLINTLNLLNRYRLVRKTPLVDKMEYSKQKYSNVYGGFRIGRSKLRKVLSSRANVEPSKSTEMQKKKKKREYISTLSTRMRGVPVDPENLRTQEGVCAYVCGTCSQLLSRRWSTLCWRQCERGQGNEFYGCVTAVYHNEPDVVAYLPGFI